MKKRRRTKNSGRMILILAILLAVVVIQFIHNRALSRRLASINIVEWQDNSISIVTGRGVDRETTVFTPEFINHSFRPQSPFGDNRSLQELMDEFIKYGQSDLYGSPRRTGDIRRIHEGIDLYVEENTPVYPVFPWGIVTEVSDDPDFIFRSTGYRGNTFIDSVGVEYGKIVRILYPEGIESLYAHLNDVYVDKGDIVGPNTIVGTTGYTGNIRFSGKPSHLHLELRNKDNLSFDPELRLHYSQTDTNVFLDKLQQIYEGKR